jgi:hypothetical protein
MVGHFLVDFRSHDEDLTSNRKVHHLTVPVVHTEGRRDGLFIVVCHEYVLVYLHRSFMSTDRFFIALSGVLIGSSSLCQEY